MSKSWPGKDEREDERGSGLDSGTEVVVLRISDVAFQSHFLGFWNILRLEGRTLRVSPLTAQKKRRAGSIHQDSDPAIWFSVVRS
jgi:hypothetical protein